MEVVLFAQKFELVDESFSVESCLFPSFDVELNRRIQLLAGDQSTERLAAIAADVKSLKRFIAALYSADAVAFLAALESFRSTNLLVGNGVPSSLILLNDRWEILHKIAQSRAQTATTHNEAPPKFKLLYDVLMNDIPQSLSKTDSQQPNSAFKTLVIVRNDAAKRTVNRFLRDGSLKDVMAHEKQDLDRFAASIPTSFRTNAFVGSRQTAQQALLKRLKLTATGASAAASISHAKEASILTPVTQTTQTSPADELSAFCNDDDSTFCIDAQDFDETFAVLKDSCILVKTFDEVQDDFFALHKPNFVVLFDYNLAIIRMLELFNSMHAGCVSRLYFLLYKGSIEEQRYLAEIRREKTAFERLIEQKSSMPHVNRPLHNDEQDSLAAAAIEAIEECGGQQAAVAAAAKQKIVVDVRELRSPLAFLLHKAGFGVVPATLPIGDYVLSRNVCIERKAIADLVASFNSGRLYTQVQAMCSAYRRAVLLVEFDAKKQSFNLQVCIIVSVFLHFII